MTTVLTFVIATMAMAAGVSVSSHPSATPPTSAAASTRGTGDGSKEAAGTRGGLIERVHDAATCDLADVEGLPENWTHGDYVRAVAPSGKDHAVREAALSACGKPTVASAHGDAEGRRHGNGAEVSAEHRADGAAHAVSDDARDGEAADGPPSDVPGATVAAAAHG